MFRKSEKYNFYLVNAMGKESMKIKAKMLQTAQKNFHKHTKALFRSVSFTVSIKRK